MDELGPPPEATATDKLNAVALAAVSELPGFGTAIELVHQTFGTALEMRQHDWLTKVAQLINELRDRTSNYDDAVTRPGFVSAVAKASVIALGEDLEEKLDMLKAVLLNSATAEPTREVDLVSMRFMRLVERLEPEHFEVMRFCRDFETLPHLPGELPSDRITTFGRVGGTPKIRVMLLADLIYEDLLVRKRSDGIKGRPSPLATPDEFHITPWGREFLDCVSSI